MWNNIAVGVATFLLSSVSRRGKGPVRGAMVLLGAWLFASAFVLDYARTTLLWSNVLLGFTLIICAVAAETVAGVPVARR